MGLNLIWKITMANIKGENWVFNQEKNVFAMHNPLSDQ